MSIDGYEPCVTHGLNGFVLLLQPGYYERPPRVDCDEGTATLRIEHRGFTRVSPGLIVTREIAVDSGELGITDEVAGDGTRRIETFFHFHPRVRIAIESPSTVRREVR